MPNVKKADSTLIEEFDGEAKGRIRVQLDCSPRAISFIKSLKKKTGTTSTAEVFRRALEAYIFLLDHLDEGYQLQFTNGEKTVEVHFCPPL